MSSNNVMQREAPPANARWWAKRTFGYGNNRTLHRGEVFQLAGLPNDRLLIDLGYIALVEEKQVGKATTYPCRVCGRQFVDPGLLQGHGRETHEKPEYTPPPPPRRQDGESEHAYKNRMDQWAMQAGAQADAAAEARDRHEDIVAPLDLTKTTASRS